MDLLPGDTGDDLRVSIRHEAFSADHPPLYEALSYTWGSPNKTHTVRVQDHDHDERWGLLVTENLYVALCHLRSSTETRTLWADAVCINQSDLAERQTQVTRMDQIYRRASRVVVWLGPGGDDSSIALNALDRVGSMLEVDWLTRNIIPRPGTEAHSDEHGRVAKMGPALLSQELRAVSRLLRREWFTRLWIRQEIGVANQDTAMIVCGNDAVRWQLFEKGGWLLYSSRFRTAESLSAEEVAELSADVRPLVDVIDGSKPGLTLGHMFSLCRRAECQDPRDRIYANLSLIDVGERECLGILPDYTLDTASVYLKFARSAVAMMGLGLLKYCVTPTKTPGLPSWVPDWSVRATPVWFSTLAGAFMGSQDSFQIDGLRLRCAGAFCGTLSRILPPLDLEAISDAQLIKYLRNMFDECPGRHETRRERARAFWEVLGSRDFSELRVPPRGYNLSLEACIRSLDAESDTGYDPSILRPFLNIYPPNRRLAFTLDHNFCLVPESAQVGDEVWDLLGVGSLMVLRPTGESTPTYTVAGEAWVDGYCNNEALLGPLPDGFEAVRALPEGQRVSVPAMREKDSGEIRFVDPRLARFPGFQEQMEAEADGVEQMKMLLGSLTLESLRGSGAGIQEITLV